MSRRGRTIAVVGAVAVATIAGTAGLVGALSLGGERPSAVPITVTSPGTGGTTTTVATTRPSPTTPIGGVPAPRRADAIGSALAALRRANIAFAAPRELGLDEQGQVELLLSARQPISELKKQISDLGNKEGANILVSDVMTATLTGLGFTIEEITPGTQVVADAGVTQWRWNVQPTRAGSRRLHLTLSALISVNGTERPYTVRTFERVLPVNVTWSGRLAAFVGKNWQWLWTTLLVPGVLALGGYLRRRRNQEKLTRG